MENDMEAIKPSETINVIQTPNNNLPASLSEVIELTRERIRTMGNQGLVRWILKAVMQLKSENDQVPLHKETDELKKMVSESIKWVEYWLETGNVNIHVGQKKSEIQKQAQNLKQNVQYWRTCNRNPDPEMDADVKVDFGKIVMSAKKLPGTLIVLAQLFKIIENIVNANNKNYAPENTNEHHAVLAVKEYVAALNGETSVNSNASGRIRSTTVREKMTEWFSE